MRSAGGPTDSTDRLTGVLLGTALGDALGLPAEGMSAQAVVRRFGRLDRFRLLGKTGNVSDDTEQAALVAQSLARYPDDCAGFIRAFRRSLLCWFCRLPWGIGLATLRSCLRIAARISPSGVMSAGNGAAMRTAVIGVYFHDRPEERRLFGRHLAEVTHLDPRAVDGALYVAELAAVAVTEGARVSFEDIQQQARCVVKNPELGQAIDVARELALTGAGTDEAVRICGNSGFVVHTVPFATFCFLRYGHDVMLCLTEAVSVGGDADSVGAIMGGWLGAVHGEAALPAALVGQIHDGPFGPTHLRALAACLAQVKAGKAAPVPRYSVVGALARNLALYPVILGHGFRRLLPW